MLCLEELIDKIIFRQERIGYQGKPFTLYKFNTLEEGKEDQRPVFKSRDDPTVISGFHRFMRRWGIDELPQVYNILKGEMALMGPRPFLADEHNALPEELREEREKYKPGILCPYYADLGAALKDEILPEEKIRTEWPYLLAKKNHSRWTDLMYIRTILYNFIRKGVRSF